VTEMNGQTSSSDLTFEMAMKQLEETVRKLETGELPLSESIERYKSAMQLVQFCRKQLDEAELQIEQLMKDDTLKPIENGQQGL
jgi:exodeoxyribonuclease VII small subunit